jgi:poly-gamma-glutamate synthesis protein (capsule biosynthesis protein)
VATRAVRRETIRLAFGGDVHGESNIRRALAAGEDPFASVAPWLREADVAIVNLETTVGRGGTRQPKAFSFRAPSSLLDAAATAGVDVVNLGNNHAWDFGADGLAATLGEVRRASMVSVGAGRTAADAYAPAVVDVDGVRVAFLGFSRVTASWATLAAEARAGVAHGFDLLRASSAVREAKRRADVVVVSVHMGRERAACPTTRDRAFADAMLQAGASIVAGHHPHVLQPVEHHDGKLVAYSLGNLVFDGRTGPRATGVLTVEVTRGGDVLAYEWAAASLVSGIPQAVDADAQASSERALRDLEVACRSREAAVAVRPRGRAGGSER